MLVILLFLFRVFSLFWLNLLIIYEMVEADFVCVVNCRYQTGALTPLIRWLSQGMHRAVVPPQLRPAVRAENVPPAAMQGIENAALPGKFFLFDKCKAFVQWHLTCSMFIYRAMKHLNLYYTQIRGGKS